MPMFHTTHTRYYLGFNLVPGIGPTRLAHLINQCGSIEAAWLASLSELMAAGLDKKSSAALIKTRNTIDLDAEMDRVFDAGVDLITIEDETYPKLLLEVPVPPPLLYVRGSFNTSDDWSLAVVGTRSPTSYGKEATRHIVSGLAARGVTIVSGMAIGIDSVAHTVALESGGRTIAVLGCGVDVVYPERNKPLAERIVEQGALVSEYPIGTQPLAANFPPRNRIISGLSLATLVAEASEKSGALITVEFALEQGRDVFAIPGSIFNRTSVGTHQLIRNGAGLITCAEDVLHELNLTTLQVQQEAAAELPADPIEGALMSFLSADPQHIDILCRMSGMPISVVSSTLALLELKGYVRRVGTMEYVRR